MADERCWECDGKLVIKKIPYDFLGERIGTFPAKVCNTCKEEIFSEETSRKIDKIIKDKGLWGLESRTRIGKSGDSLNVIINKKLAKFMKLKKGEEVLVYPENKKKLIISL